MKKKFVIILLVVMVGIKGYAQLPYTDPTRAATILVFTDQAKKTLNAQERAQLVMSGMHVYVKEEVEATANFQREFNEYLDQFNEVIQIAAETYGIFNEVKMVSKNIKSFIDVLDEGRNMDNVVAVAAYPRRNKVFTDLVKTSLDLAKDIHAVCFSKTKMTQKERLKIVLSMRPKLRKVNDQLRRMTLFIKYTNLIDVWNKLIDTKYKPANRKEIIKRCKMRWKDAWVGK